MFWPCGASCNVLIRSEVSHVSPWPAGSSSPPGAGRWLGLANYRLRTSPKFSRLRPAAIFSPSQWWLTAADSAEEDSVIIRNSSTLRVSEPIWTHQREAAPKDALQALDNFALKVEYTRGQQIYKEDTSVEYWYRIESGVARRFSARADGRRQIVDLLLPGDFFGFGVGGKHHFAVEAVLDGTVVARYPRSRLEVARRAGAPHRARASRRRLRSNVAPAWLDPQSRQNNRRGEGWSFSCQDGRSFSGRCRG